MSGLPGVLIAHRAANAPDTLRSAAAIADVAEADVHLFHGRLEVRHAKTIGPIGLRWERWYLLDRATPRPLLGDLLRAAASLDIGLMLDLKGPDPRIAEAVRRAIDGWQGSRRLIVCGRVWRTIDRLRRDADVQTLHSVGSPRQLQALLRRYRPGDLEGISIDWRLLAPEVVADLRTRAPEVWAWIVDDPARARELTEWGATGIITDVPGSLRG